MRHKKQAQFYLIAFALFLTTSCIRTSDIISETEEESTEVILSDDADNVDDHEDASDYTWSSSDEKSIVLNGNTISSGSSDVSIDGSVATITGAGTYALSGSLNDGQIIVDTEDESIVRLILNGVDISCSSNAPIYIENAEKVMLVLLNGTSNSVSDGSSYSSGEEDANAAIFSKSDLTIFGEGSLSVDGNYSDGITSKDGLIIASGNITVKSVDDGIRGKDYLIIEDGNITVNSSGDGLVSDNIEDEGRGYITINDGSLTITSGCDAIQAGKDVLIVYGTLDLTSGGGSSSTVSSSSSAKGIKSGVSTIIYGGTITINAADDAIHTDGNLEIYDGTFYIASGDDGIHSEYNSVYTSGNIYITKSYEGLESALGSITINGGNFNIVASDDAINISAGGASFGGPGHKSTSSSSDYVLNIAGGYIAINCGGDGLDSNGSLVISGGTQLVSSSTRNDNSALDYDVSCQVSGGFLVAVGSSGMAEAPGTSSSQYSVLVIFKSQQSAGTIIHIEDNEGTEILTYKPPKAYQSIAFSSDNLEKGATYKVYTGGSSSGSATDGLYTSGTYSGGNLYTSFTISSVVTKVY
ncbi:carbohydrate-binding domain-containing protein [uncultured Draconibacterium sp.]|uniref:carbohydrate-binding domain-containing protein n=1 Tax=uncultured Draconibacterium sp. TaxID=1573823 RepID=UPI003216789E